MAQVAATIDGSPVTQQVLATIIAATAYDNSMPPGAQGQPKHPVWSLDESDPEQVMNVGGAYVAIYNVAAWEQMWGSAMGDNYVADAIAELSMLLRAAGRIDPGAADTARAARYGRHRGPGRIP